VNAWSLSASTTERGRLRPDAGEEDLGDLDARIAAVTEWIYEAGAALLTLYDQRLHRFIRDTRGDEPGPTSTSRAFLAIVELLRVLAEEDGVRSLGAVQPGRPFQKPGLRRDHGQLAEDALAVIRDLATGFFGQLPQQRDNVRLSRDNDLNMFTDVHLLLGVAVLDTLLGGWEFDSLGALNLGMDPPAMAAIRAVAKELATGIENDVRRWGGGKVHPDDKPHDFITFSAVRALDAVSWRLMEGRLPDWSRRSPPGETKAEEPAHRNDSQQLRAHEGSQGLALRVSADVLRQLGYDSAGITSRIDPGELVFGLAMLERLKVEHGDQLLRRGIEVVTRYQTADGAWPTSRVITYGTKRLLYIASYEVALVLATILNDRLADGDLATTERLLPVLDAAFDFVSSSHAQVGHRRGWANDRTRWRNLIESWTTAVVLMFLVRYRDCLMRYRQQLVLSRYDVIFPDLTPTDIYPWPDLWPLIRLPETFSPESFTNLSDPTEQGSVAEALTSKFLKPIGSNWIARPMQASLVIPGPPGTRKTSLVKSLAGALSWPLVTLSPPDFLRPAGLEGFEATTARIFHDLLRLRRCIVLFDECEDFFRVRTPGGDAPTGARTIGAFITTGMLPRLQALRDHRWAIFVLATNSELKDLDEAAFRPGRFDFQLKMDHPKLAAQIRYVRKELGGDTPLIELLLGALDIVEQERLHAWEQVGKQERREAPLAVTFNLLNAIIQDMRLNRETFQVSEPRRLADDIMQRLNPKIAGPPSLLG